MTRLAVNVIENLVFDERLSQLRGWSGGVDFGTFFTITSAELSPTIGR